MLTRLDSVCSLRNVECQLDDDRPPVAVQGPAPPLPAPASVFRLGHLLVQRDRDGVLTVGAASAPAPAPAPASASASAAGSWTVV